MSTTMMTFSLVADSHSSLISLFFLFTAPPTTLSYTLSLHDALPICVLEAMQLVAAAKPRIDGRLFLRILDRDRPLDEAPVGGRETAKRLPQDRKSTRLNSSH